MFALLRIWRAPPNCPRLCSLILPLDLTQIQPIQPEIQNRNFRHQFKLYLQHFLFKPFKVMVDDILIKVIFKILQFLLDIQNFNKKSETIFFTFFDPNLIQIIIVFNAIKPVTSDQHVDTGMLSVIGVDKKFIFQQHVLRRKTLDRLLLYTGVCHLTT